VSAIVVGASAGLGAALAGALASAGHDVVLVGRDGDDLQRVAADVGARFGRDVSIVVCDAADPVGFADRIEQALGDRRVEVAMFPIGVSHDDLWDGPSVDQQRLINVNLGSVVTSSSFIAARMAAAGGGRIVGFSSIAATRGRGRNAAYAAAKRGLESWFESLGSGVATSGVKVCCVVLGYVDTNLAFGQALPFPVADVDALAQGLVHDLPRLSGRVHRPRWWRPIAFLIRHLPEPLFRKLSS
jgi:short-subunit dehydrogenase